MKSKSDLVAGIIALLIGIGGIFGCLSALTKVFSTEPIFPSVATPFYNPYTSSWENSLSLNPLEGVFHIKGLLGFISLCLLILCVMYLKGSIKTFQEKQSGALLIRKTSVYFLWLVAVFFVCIVFFAGNAEGVPDGIIWPAVGKIMVNCIESSILPVVLMFLIYNQSQPGTFNLISRLFHIFFEWVRRLL